MLIPFIDSRISVSPQHVFYALRGSNHDGHDFILDLIKRGVTHFVVSEEYKVPSFEILTIHYRKVKSPLRALQEDAFQHRNRFHIPVIGITGSNGKTIVKEWLHQLLEDSFSIIKSPKSYNSQVGVPLSVLEMKPFHELAIFEAGISKENEMKYLEHIIKPNIGIFTNIGNAHSEGFSSKRKKIEEKVLLFKNTDIVVCHSRYSEIKNVLEKQGNKIFSWGIEEEDDLRILEQKNHDNKHSTLLLGYQNQKIRFDCLPFVHQAEIENFLHCISVIILLGVDLQKIKISSISTIEHRLEIKEGINNTLLLDDTYNNDLAGLKVALKYLKQQAANLPKTVIISDFLETKDLDIYQKVADVFQKNNIHKVLGIGTDIQNIKPFLPSNIISLFYPNVEAMTASLPILNEEAILIKGARRFHFEKIVKRLQKQNHRTTLEVNLDALIHNLNFFKRQIKENTKLMVMVKAFAYGNGAYEVAKLLEYEGINYLAVAYIDEGIYLRKKGIEMPIMVMNIDEGTFDTLIRYNLQPVIYKVDLLKEFGRYLQHRNKQHSIHIEFDTGMTRLGFQSSDSHIIIKTLISYQELKVESIFSHLAIADEEGGKEYTENQYLILKETMSILKKSLPKNVLYHLLNSSGIIRYNEYQMDMVRLGIGLYGIECNNYFQEQLKVVATFKTTISQIRIVEKGVSVGYSRKWIAPQKSKIATIAVGYADGYNRLLSNGKGKVQIAGKLVPIIGNICMDMCMVDISEISDAYEGQEVVLFGENPTISDLASEIGTIPYEILTSINQRVPRVFTIN